jgi:hypothetical protein
MKPAQLRHDAQQSRGQEACIRHDHPGLLRAQTQRADMTKEKK